MIMNYQIALKQKMSMLLSASQGGAHN